MTGTGPSPLLVVTGPPGAGKSTVARLLAERDDPTRIGPSVLVEGDVFFGFLTAGMIPPWLPESNAQNESVTDAAASSTGRFVATGWSTIYDGVLGPWFIDRFLGAADLDVADYVVLLPPVERCLQRVRDRVGHGFDDPDATRKMHHEFTVAPVEARHLLTDDSLDPAATAARILADRAAGTLRYRRRPVG